MTSTLVCADVLEWAATTPPIGAHALLADPPYELNFMNSRWDASGVAFRPETWAALARHLLPGAFVMAFASSRGYHRLACAMEDAGLILHPSIFNYRTGEAVDVPSLMGWSNGAGFPKATRIDTQVDACGGLLVATDDVCDAIVRARQARHLTQRECDERFCDGTTNWTWYEGRPRGRRMPDTATFAKIAEAWPELQGYQDKVAAINREVIGQRATGLGTGNGSVPLMGDGSRDLTAPATPLAQTWAGHRYGLQALKPALEPIIVAQVPYAGRPVDSITVHGAGALNIGGGRIGRQGGMTKHAQSNGVHRDRWEGNTPTGIWEQHGGRWPANLALQHLPTCQPLGTCQVHGNGRPNCEGRLYGDGNRQVYGIHGRAPYHATRTAHDGTETVQAWACADGCPVAAFDGQAGERQAGGAKDCRGQEHGYKGSRSSTRSQTYDSYADDGPASRFFFTADWSLDVAEQLAQADAVRYCAKASAAERHAGLAGRNDHPCIKPLALVRWLATLLLPPAAYAPRRLLVPFCGTGSEFIGGILAGWETVLGIEDTAAHVTLAERRVAYWTGMRPQTSTPLPREEPPAPRAAHQTQLSLW